MQYRDILILCITPRTSWRIIQYGNFSGKVKEHLECLIDQGLLLRLKNQRGRIVYQTTEDGIKLIEAVRNVEILLRK